MGFKEETSRAIADVKVMMSLPPLQLSMYGKISLFSSLLQAVIVMGLEIAISVIFASAADIQEKAQEGSGRSIFVYLIIFILSQIFQFYLILDALWNQNTIQIFTHVIYTVCMFAFAIFQIFQIREAINEIDDNPELTESAANILQIINPLLIATIVVLGVFSVISLLLSFKLYMEFGWKIYKKIGADPRKRSMFRSYQIFVMLLKLDLYFFLAFAIQFLALVLAPTNYEVPPTIIAIIASPFICLLVVFAMKRENRTLVILWLVFLILIIAYFIFKIARIYQPEEAFKYVGSGKFLTLFAAVSLFVFTLTFANTIICYMNFDRGLKDHLLGGEERLKSRSISESDDPKRRESEAKTEARRKMELA